MKIPSLLVIVASMSFIAIAMFVGQTVIGQQTTELESRVDLKKLLTQRRDVLVKRVEALEIQNSEGQTTFGVVAMARDELFKAELELVSTKKDRLKILQKRVENMRRYEESEKLRHRSGVGPLDSMLLATAARLQAEIDLSREKE